jgi:tagatose-1,6-bisphosphate aldolase
LRPEAPETVTYEELVAFKGEVVSAIAPYVTGALLDPEYGAAQVIRTGQLPGACGLIVAVEETGYAALATDRETRLVEGFDAAKAARMGASAVKMLLYYHPNASRAADQEAVVSQVAADCEAAEIPLIVEPLSFSRDPEQPLSGNERTEVVIETARRLSALNIDMLKMEFPVDPASKPDDSVWRNACMAVSEASSVPWLLLSAGVSFELFARQAKVACEAGASGVLAGRAVWREASELAGVQRAEFLRGPAVDRMVELRGIVEQTAKPINLGAAGRGEVDEGWCKGY